MKTEVTTHGTMERIRVRRWLPWMLLVYGVVLFAVGFLTRSAHQVLLQEVRHKVLGLVEAVAHQVSDRDIEVIRTEADMDRPEFEDVLAFYVQTKEAYPDVRYVYSFRPAPDLGEGRWRFVVDANPFDEDLDGDGTISKEEEGVRPGLEYEITDPELVALVARGMKEPVAGEEFTSDEWGTYISGYAPIVDRTSGNVVAIQGVDITREAIQRKQFMVNVTAAVTLLVLLVLVTITLAALFGKAGALDKVRRLDRELQAKNSQLKDTVVELRDRERIMNEDLAMAREVQQQLLPRQFPFSSRLRFASLYEPCTLIGGDLYDVFPVSDRLTGFYIADVCGHGVSAALITAQLKLTTDRYRAELFGGEPSGGGGHDDTNHELFLRIMGGLNNFVEETISSDSFVTLQMGVLDSETGDLLLYNAGHTPPALWRRSSGKAERVELPSNIAFGLIRDFPYRVTRHHVEPGDKLVLYTDGLTERQSKDRELFGLERLLEVISRHGEEAPQALLDRIVKENNDFADRSASDDDLAVMVIEYLGPC